MRQYHFFGSILASFVVVCLTIGCAGVSTGPDDIRAFVAAQMIVESRLKSPSTADFCSYPEATVTDLGGGRYRVSAYVDAQNGFGATVRTHFVCTVSSSDGDNWDLESLDMK